MLDTEDTMINLQLGVKTRGTRRQKIDKWDVCKVGAGDEQ